MTLTVSITDSFAEAWALAPRWQRLPAAGASAIYTSSAWCLKAWQAFPDLGPPRLVTVMERGTLLGLLPLTAASDGTGLSWAGWPLGDEHDARIGPAGRREEARPFQDRSRVGRYVAVPADGMSRLSRSGAGQAWLIMKPDLAHDQGFSAGSSP
jgi:CelD/BcsL family acetyltransferase involved in cellulose biosynthesis